MRKPLIIIDRLTFGYSAFSSIFHHFSLNIHQHELITIVGSNGTGKTTLLKIIAQLIPIPDHMIWHGTKNIAYVPEHPIMPEFLSAWDFLYYKALLCTIPKDLIHDQIKAILDKMYLYSHRFNTIGTFSKGMRQRLNLAQALLVKPDILLLDEPFSGLDSSSRLLVEEILQTYHGTVMYTAHELPAYADKIIYFSNQKTIWYH